MTHPLPAGIRPVRYAAKRPDAFEAFALRRHETILLDPLAAENLDHACAETTARWAWDRGDRLAIREIGETADRLHIYAVRRKAEGTLTWNGYVPSVEHARWLEHIGTVDLNAVAGIAPGAVGVEVDLHEHRQRKRPEGARWGAGRREAEAMARKAAAR